MRGPGTPPARRSARPWPDGRRPGDGAPAPILSLRRRHRGERSADARCAHPPPSSTGSCARARPRARGRRSRGCGRRSSGCPRGARLRGARTGVQEERRERLGALPAHVRARQVERRRRAPPGAGASRGGRARRGRGSPRGPRGGPRARPGASPGRAHVPFAAARSRTTRDASSGPSADAERGPARARDATTRTLRRRGRAVARGRASRPPAPPPVSRARPRMRGARSRTT